MPFAVALIAFTGAGLEAVPAREGSLEQQENFINEKQ